MNSTTYAAHWGKSLRWMSAFSTIFMVGLSLFLVWKVRPPALRWVPLLPSLFLVVAGLFSIRGYIIAPDELAIRRLFWTTRLPLAGLESATAVPGAIRGSRRVCGNGGMFSITGWYSSRSLGIYRAFVTDLKDTVVLRFKTRTVVVSPENPEQFAAEISRFAGRG